MAKKPVPDRSASERALTNKQRQQARAERAAAALQEKERRERRRQILTVVGVLAAIAVLVGGGFLVNSLRDQTPANASAVPPPGSDLGLTVGSDTAEHTLVVYEDFLCPFCAEFEKQTRDQLAQLADQGKVQVEYRPVVFLSRAGPYSGDSTLVFMVVHDLYGDEVAKSFHDLLFESQPSEEGPFPSREDLYSLAAQAGADAGELSAAIDEGQGADQVEAATKKAADLKINSTPTLVLDGKAFTTGRTIDDLAANLLQALQ